MLGNNQIELDFERKHLDFIIEIAKRQLSDLKLSNKEKKTSVISSKKEMMEDSPHFISSKLWSMENFHELVELSQYATPLSNYISDLEMEAKKILLLERLTSV
jgi:DNA helicase-2/ATP-dependent DNA helicase PcrA